MGNILNFIRLRGHTYESKDGIVKVYTPNGEKPNRKAILKLLREAHKQLLEERL